MEPIVVQVPDSLPIQRQLSAMSNQVQAIVVSNRDEHRQAQEWLQDLAGLEHRVVDLFQTPKQTAHAAHKAVCEAENKLLRPIQDARRVVTRAITIYEAEERWRVEEEVARRTLEAQRRAEDRLLAEAIVAEANGETTLAEEIITNGNTVPAPTAPVEAETAKVEGIVTRERWHAEVTDLLALVKWVAENPGFVNLLAPDMPALNAQARALRNAMAIPGVKAVVEIEKAVRAA